MIDSSRIIRILIGVSASALVFVFVFLLWERPQSAQERELSRVLAEKFAIEDTVTQSIRDRTKRIYRIETRNAEERENASKVGEVVADYNSFVLAAVSELPPRSESGFREVATSINLPGASFDPIKSPLPLASDAADANRTGYYIVQFGVTATDELLDSLRATGVEVIQYVPHQAFIVYGSGESVNLAAGHNRVRWAGRYAPEHKISTVVAEQVDALRGGREPVKGISKLERTTRGKAIFDVAVFERGDLKTAAGKIAAAGEGRLISAINLPNNFFNVVRVELPIDSLSAVSEIEEVFSIESWSRPAKEDEIAAHIVAGNYVGNAVSPPGYNPLAQFGVDGTGVTVSVGDDGVGIPGDGGFYVTGGNTIDALRGAPPGADGHGHLQASIIAGDLPYGGLDANNYNYGIGIAPKANIINIPYLRGGYTGTEASIFEDTISTAGPNGVLGFISNNSWGNLTNGNSYDSYAAQFDGFVRDASLASTIDPVVVVFSAGNLGTSGLTRPKIAKNLIAVAATENIRPSQPTPGGSTGAADNIEQVPDFSARGPAIDGRIKPDISAPGVAVTGSRSGPGIPGMSNVDTHHRVSSGTSHAAPQVAGAAALFTQFWKNTNGGNNPSPAMVKAALINGAVEVTGTGATAPRPNNSEGWGRVNLKNVLNTGAAITYVDQTATLAGVGAARTYTGSVADAGRPLRVSLVWTDPPGAGNPALVNDLDLEVEVGGNFYRANVFAVGSSVTGGSADGVNNVENVFLPAGVSGPITVRVRASAVNGDGVLGNADLTDQHFALVVFNASVAAAPSAIPFGEAASVTTGNFTLEPNECNLLNIPVTNFGDGTATAVSATISTSTPGVSVIIPTANYPDIPAGATQTNSSPFQISTDNTVACLSSVNLTLTVFYSGGASPAVFNYTLPVGTPPIGNYNFTASAGATISPSGSIVSGSADDDAVVNFIAPFSFSVYGTNVAGGSNIRLSTNGNIRIETSGSTVSSVNNAGLPTSSGGSLPASLPTLFPYWDDLDMRAAITTGGGIFTEVTGVAPSRTLKIEWRARHFDPGNSLAPPDTNFAVYFHENSEQFEYVYAQTGAGAFASGAAATVGVQSASTGTAFTQYSFNAASLSAGQRLSFARTAGGCSPGSGPCIFTSAPAEVGGRVVSGDGRGVRNARVTIADESGGKRTALTNSFGYFRFVDVSVGETYIVTVSARGLTFRPRAIQVTESVSGLTIVAAN